MELRTLVVVTVAVGLPACADPAKPGGPAGDTEGPVPTDSADPGTTAGDSAETGAPDSGGDTASGDCADAPAVTWNSWGGGFLLGHCQGCHASTAPERYGAPPEVVFDTVEDAWTHAEAILRTAVTTPITMPPAGGVDPDEQVLLHAWLTCAAPGT